MILDKLFKIEENWVVFLIFVQRFKGKVIQ